MISKPCWFVFVFLILLVSCSEKLEDKIAYGGKKYGGIFTYFTPERTDVFFPLYSPTVYNQRIHTQIFEPLFILNEKGIIVPNLAKGMETSKNGKIITINIRDDVYFHENDCFSSDRKMTAEDVKFSLDFACSGNKWNSMGGLLRDKIKGGKDYYRKTINHQLTDGVKGIKIINDTTICLELTSDFSDFKKILAHPCISVFSKRAVEYYKDDFIKNPVGTGPFMLNSCTKTTIVLERNPSYWKKDRFGNQLPFLSEIHIKIGKGLKAEYQAFAKKETDIIFELPVNQLDFTFGSLEEAQKGNNLLHRVIVKKGANINYLSFDCSSYPFNNPLVRKAFSLAIDRKRICLDAMNGEGNYSINGFIPRNSYYEPNEMELLKYDPILARKLMIDAGYTEKSKFPKLTLYINAQKGGAADNWSEEIVAEIKQNIGVELVIKYCTLDQKYGAILSKKAKVWKSAWVPDYPDADAYLSQFYGNVTQSAKKENYYNSFNSLIFDSLYERSQIEKDIKERKRLQRECDKTLIDQAAIAPLFSEDLFLVVNLNVRDFYINTSGIINFSKIYIKEVF